MSSERTATATGLRRLDTPLPGVFEIRPKIFQDVRGFFVETYHVEKYAEIGVRDVFVQDNHSRSVKHTLRGLHYQLRHAQAKLCRVVEGEVLDVAVDIRIGSPTFGKWTGVMLCATEQNQIYIPAGFAHGFIALTSVVQFLYKCSEFYAPRDEYGIRWSDPQLSIQWGVSNPIVSEKDAAYPALAEIPPELLPKYSPR